MTEIRMGEGTLLLRALEHAKAAGYGTEAPTPLKDREGQVGYQLPQGVLVAKRYVWKGLISIHENLMKYAQQENLNVLVYMADSDRLFVLDARAIEEVTRFVNVRGYARMVNFDLKEAAQASQLRIYK